MAKAKAKKTTPKEKKKVEPALPDEKMERDARNMLEDAAAAYACSVHGRDAYADMMTKQDLFNAVLLLAGVVSARAETRDARPRWVRDIERTACFSDMLQRRMDELLRHALAARQTGAPFSSLADLRAGVTRIQGIAGP